MPAKFLTVLAFPGLLGWGWILNFWVAPSEMLYEHKNLMASREEDKERPQTSGRQCLSADKIAENPPTSCVCSTEGSSVVRDPRIRRDVVE